MCFVCVVPVLAAHAPKDDGHVVVLRVTGGTHAEMAPPVSYIQTCLEPRLCAMGLQCTTTIERFGFYPCGGGCANVAIKRPKAPLVPIVDTTRTPVVKLEIRCFVAGLALEIAERAARAAERMLHKNMATITSSTGSSSKPSEEHKAEIVTIVQDVSKESCGVGMWVEVFAFTASGQILGANSIGKRGKPAETVAEEAVQHLIEDLAQGGVVDEFMQDQLLIFMAMAKGQSVLRTGKLSLHSQTMIALINQLAHTPAPVFTTAAASDGTDGTVITCEGLSLL